MMVCLLLLFIFGSLHKKGENTKKNNKKKYIRKKTRKIITVRRGYQSAQKMIKIG
jgi:hypothetical protein